MDKIIADIIQFFTEHKSDVIVIKPILKRIKELGYANPKEIDSVKDAEIIVYNAKFKSSKNGTIRIICTIFYITIFNKFV